MLAISTYMLVFRLFHITFGVLWVGSAFLVAAFIEPTAANLGPQAGPFMTEMIEKRKAAVWITLFATINVLAGGFLYWGAWHEVGSFGDWIGTGFGRALTTGAVLAITGYIIGFAGIRPAAEQLGAIGAEVRASGGPPTPEQASAMQAAQHRMRLFSRIDVVILILAVIFMATAREWGGAV